MKRKEQTIRNEVWAWEVYKSTPEGGLENYFKYLVAIHAAPEECWPYLCRRLVAEDWTVE